MKHKSLKGVFSVRKTTDQFLSEVRLVHGDQFDYSLVEYTGWDKKIKIICDVHGVFEQRAGKHLKGQGCPKCVKDKRKHTFIKRYGVDNPMKSKVFQEKSKEIVRKKYGVDYINQSDTIIAKRKRTCLNKYGADNPMKVREVRNRVCRTNLERYGYENVSCNKDIQVKRKQTMVERYGVYSPLKNDSIKEKMLLTVNTRYGVLNVNQVDEHKHSAKVTCIKKYGVGNPFQSESIKEKCRLTMINRYGVEYSAQNKDIYEKVICTKRDRNNLNSSSCENIFYDKLLQKFDQDDVIWHYKSEEYPFLCDFYVISQNLYIELNFIWTHGGHWYDVVNDSVKYEDWLERSRDSKYYANAINTWCDRDVKKRQLAKENNLNYVVLWKKQDIDDWFSLGCPSGRDWKREYTWKER